MHSSAIQHLSNIFYFVLYIRYKIPSISIQRCRRQKETVFVLQGVNECSFHDQNCCFLFICLFFSSQPSFPSHHKWMWEKERFKDETNGCGQRIWKDVVAIKWDEDDNGRAGLRWRSTIFFGHVQLAMSSVHLFGDVRWEVAYRFVFQGRGLCWTYKSACLQHRLGWIKPWD